MKTPIHRSILALAAAIQTLLVAPCLRAASAESVFSSPAGYVVPLAAGIEPARSGSGQRLVVVTAGWTDLEQSSAGGAWQPAPAREVIWDEGGTWGAVTWDMLGHDPALTAGFSVRIAPPGSARTLRMVNASGRAGLRRTGGDVITGFVFSGGPRRFLIRAAGPALVPFGVTQALVNPAVTVFDARQQPVVTADDWDLGSGGSAIAQAADEIGAFPFASGSADAALLIDLPAGAYTVVVDSKAGDEGVTLAEAYEMREEGQAGGLLNLSLRARVESGDRVAIPGFVTEGNSNRRYLIRAVGPGLIPHGVTAPLANPKLTVHQGDVAVAANDDWGASLAADAVEAAAAQVHAFPLERTGRDSAVLIALPPGLFTVVIEDGSGAGAQGEVLVEVYLVPAGQGA